MISGLAPRDRFGVRPAWRGSRTSCTALRQERIDSFGEAAHRARPSDERGAHDFADETRAPVDERGIELDEVSHRASSFSARRRRSAFRQRRMIATLAGSARRSFATTAVASAFSGAPEKAAALAARRQMLDPIAGYGGVGRDDCIDAARGDASAIISIPASFIVGSDLYRPTERGLP